MNDSSDHVAAIGEVRLEVSNLRGELRESMGRQEGRIDVVIAELGGMRGEVAQRMAFQDTLFEQHNDSIIQLSRRVGVMETARPEDKAGLRAHVSAEVNGLRVDLEKQVDDLSKDIEQQIRDLKADLEPVKTFRTQALALAAALVIAVGPAVAEAWKHLFA